MKVEEFGISFFHIPAEFLHLYIIVCPENRNCQGGPLQEVGVGEAQNRFERN